MMSTAPWDQPRNGTTVTRYYSGHAPVGDDRETLEEFLQSPKFTVDYRTEFTARDRSGKLVKGCYLLIRWENPHHKKEVMSV